jgi:outer membrane protein assembly factor BamE (lipoprotein component of BamABCDE complex)
MSTRQVEQIKSGLFLAMIAGAFIAALVVSGCTTAGKSQHLDDLNQGTAREQMNSR